MSIDSLEIWADITAIRKNAPLIHNITNYVVMNTTANALLALGASPVMAHAEPEVEQMVDIAGAVVINIGTLSDSWIKSMFLACTRAHKNNIPIVLDPVGAGATDYRTKTVQELIRKVPPSIIRGNGSEIMALCRQDIKTKGVDSREASHAALLAARELNREFGSVVCITGKRDYIVKNETVFTISNGHAMMPRVTGLGCTASALCGAFAAVNPLFDRAAAHAMAVMGIAGEIAAKTAAGPGTLQSGFIDALYNLSKKDIIHYFKE